MFEFSGPREAHKHKGIFSGKGVGRFTGGFQRQGPLPRLISDGFEPFVFDDPGSEEHSFMWHSFACVFGAQISNPTLRPNNADEFVSSKLNGSWLRL